MKSSQPADARSAPTHYAPSVPMTVYRELAAELRANQAVIDSLNSRNQQLLQQNQILKQEIHNVVQATLSLGQVAGVARQTAGGGQGSPMEFPSAIAPDTLAKLVRGEAQPGNPPTPHAPQSPSAAPATHQNRVPRAIASTPPQPSSNRAPQPPAQSQSNPQNKSAARPTGNTAKEMAREVAREKARDMARQIPNRQQQTAQKQRQSKVPRDIGRTVTTAPKQSVMTQPAKQKLFTEQPNGYRSSTLDASENKEIGGIWLVLSIILIIVTAFGAGFLIMKPLLNDR